MVRCVCVCVYLHVGYEQFDEIRRDIIEYRILNMHFRNERTFSKTEQVVRRDYLVECVLGRNKQQTGHHMCNIAWSCVLGTVGGRGVLGGYIFYSNTYFG